MSENKLSALIIIFKSDKLEVISLFSSLIICSIIKEFCLYIKYVCKMVSNGKLVNIIGITKEITKDVIFFK